MSKKQSVDSNEVKIGFDFQDNYTKDRFFEEVHAALHRAIRNFVDNAAAVPTEIIDEKNKNCKMYSFPDVTEAMLTLAFLSGALNVHDPNNKSGAELLIDNAEIPVANFEHKQSRSLLFVPPATYNLIMSWEELGTKQQEK